MALITDHIVEDGISFVLLIVILALLWFRPWQTRRMRLRVAKTVTRREQNNAAAARKKAA
jgi:hypothetical protein